MPSILANVSNRGATPALIATMSFSEARLRVIADNVANVHTPGYRAKQLDVGSFQHALRKALDEKGNRTANTLNVEAGRQVATRQDGTLEIQATHRPVDNALFHDGTNLSIEREMADLAETGMMHDLAATLLQGRFEGLRKAIRGTM